jgi:chromosome segregation ATPase
MKSNLAAIILVLACLGLGVVLWNQHRTHTDETNNLDQTIDRFSNSISAISLERSREVVSNEILRQNLNAAQFKASNELMEQKIKLEATLASLEKSQAYGILASNTVNELYSRLTEQNLANSNLQSTLNATLSQTRRKASNDIAAIQATLSNAYANLDKSRSDAKAAADKADADIADKDKQLAQLQAQNAYLNAESTNLFDAMTKLQAQADAARDKLATTERDNSLLMSEYTLAEAKREELQNKFNDVAALKAQLKSVQDNIVIARRVDWIERGLYESNDKKGDQVLINPRAPASPATNVALSVDLHQNGAVRINSAVPTNAPPTNKPTARAPSNRSAP